MKCPKERFFHRIMIIMRYSPDYDQEGHANKPGQVVTIKNQL